MVLKKFFPSLYSSKSTETVKSIGKRMIPLKITGKSNYLKSIAFITIEISVVGDGCVGSLATTFVEVRKF